MILKAGDPPKIGAKVVDENLKPVGTVLDVLGPVSSPYVTVKPVISEPKRLIESTLYTIASTGHRKERRKFG